MAAAGDDTLYDGTFSQVSREINAIATVGQAQDLYASTVQILDFATGLAGQLHTSLYERVIGIEEVLSEEQALSDINDRRVRLNAAMAPIDGLAAGDGLPSKPIGDEIKAAMNSAWAEAYTVAGVADALPSLTTEITRVAQNFHEAPAAFEAVGAGAAKIAASAADALAQVVDKILAALTSKLWPWLVVAGLIFLVIEFGPELRALAGGWLAAHGKAAV